MMQNDIQNGKGDKRRPCLVSRKVAARNWDRIFARKPMRAYLSVDLDYWNRLPYKSIRTFFEKLRLLKCPLLIVKDHHELLDDINTSPCNCLINVDYHSDLADNPVVLDCGTWGNFVTWQDRGSFIWRYPSAKCLVQTTGTGYCHQIINPFETPVTQWRSVTKQQGIARLPWSKVARVGVAISIDWQHVNHLTRLTEQLLHDKKIITTCREFADCILQQKQMATTALVPRSPQ